MQKCKNRNVWMESHRARMETNIRAKIKLYLTKEPTEENKSQHLNSSLNHFHIYSNHSDARLCNSRLFQSQPGKRQKEELASSSADASIRTVSQQCGRLKPQCNIFSSDVFKWNEIFPTMNQESRSLDSD